MGQAPDPPVADSKAKAIAPFVDSGSIAVLHLDLAQGNFPAIVARLSGGPGPGVFADASKPLLAWSESLRKAGAKELFVVVNAGDMPGLPVVVVPLSPGADATEIGKLLCGGGKQPPPVCFSTCATLHNAVMAGTAAALDRARNAAPPRPELAAAFSALNDRAMSLQLLILPSADTRRILEETVPTLPRELGGGPITEITRGLLWATIGLDAGPKPSFKLVVASPSADAAKSLRGLGERLFALMQRAPEYQQIMPEFSKFAAQVKTETVGDRIIVTADAQVAAGLIDSGLRPSREAANRSVCTTNEMQIALAVHNYISLHKNTFPPAFTIDKTGKPLLSWRVQILPFLEQDALFKEFHLDEPWDSEHNRTLIAKMPRVYRCPTESDRTAREGKTRYIAPRDQGAIFRGAEPVKLNEITDGTANTIMFIETSDDHAVTWTKPDDWEVSPDPKTFLSGILSAHSSHQRTGSNCAFADGSVRFLSETIKPTTLRALITYAGNEVISSDDQ